MKQAIKISDNLIKLIFKDANKEKFMQIVRNIKKIPGYRFDFNNKNWFIPYNDENIHQLKKWNFELIGFFEEINPEINITVYNERIFINSNYKNLLYLKEKFTFKDFSQAFVGNTFFKNRIKNKCLLDVKDDIGILPIGFLSDLQNVKSKYDFRKRIDTIDENKIKDNLAYLILREEQIKAVKVCIDKINAIIKLPTGVGKCCVGDTEIEIEYNDEEIIL